MYDKGDIKLGREMDESGDYKVKYCAYLPHSCGSWVIGGKEEIKMMIDDLKTALDEYDNTQAELRRESK